MQNRIVDYKKERIKYENNNQRNRNYQRNLVISAPCYAHMVFIQCNFFGLYVYGIVLGILINIIFRNPQNLKQSSQMRTVFVLKRYIKQDKFISS